MTCGWLIFSLLIAANASVATTKRAADTEAGMRSNPLKVRGGALIGVDASRLRKKHSERARCAIAQLELKMRGVVRGAGLRAGR
jgi:hypothetical protein